MTIPTVMLTQSFYKRELESQCSSETKEAVVALARELPHLTDCQLAMALQQPCWQVSWGVGYGWLPSRSHRYHSRTRFVAKLG